MFFQKFKIGFLNFQFNFDRALALLAVIRVAADQRRAARVVHVRREAARRLLEQDLAAGGVICGQVDKDGFRGNVLNVV